MYFLDELTKEHQKELLNEAELVRSFKQVDDKGPEGQASSLRNTVGDLLIDGGLRLKGQQPITHRSV